MRLTDLKVESTDGILVATAVERVSLSDAISVFTKACDVVAERGLDLILVDCLSVEGELSTFERYELGRAVANYCNSRSMGPKIATVGKLPLIDGFAALVASNRGLVAETFSELPKAIAWLKAIPELDGWEAYCENCGAFREARCAQECDAGNGSEYFEFVCNTCHSILLTFQRLGTQAAESKPARPTALSRCPHCGELNVFPGFDQIMAYVCKHCGQGVDATPPVQ